MSIVLKTDELLQKLSQSRYVTSITFGIAFFEQSFSPILPEAYTALVLSYRKDISWKFLSFVSACGSTLGALGTYLLGYFFYTTYGETIMYMFGWEGVFEKARTLFADNVFMTQFLATLTPLPDRVFSFVAGAFGVNLLIILAATMLGRILRSFTVSYIAYEWGDEARGLIKKHTKVALALLVVALIVYLFYTGKIGYSYQV